MKILIAAPIGGKKQYSINAWFDWIATQTFPKESVEACICVNGADNLELKKMIDKVEISYPDGYKQHITTLLLPDSEKMSVVQKITYSREMIRRYAVDQGFDYIFFLDTDTVPFHKDAIQKLIDRDKDVISGLYFYKNTKQPVIIDAETNTNISLEKCEDLVEKKEICEVWGFGFGCLLLSRRAFETNEFDYGLFGDERSDDFGYCHVLEQKGIRRYFDPEVICKHYTDPNAKKDHGTKLPFYVK